MYLQPDGDYQVELDICSLNWFIFLNTSVNNGIVYICTMETKTGLNPGYH